MLNDFYINRDDLIKTIKGIGDTIYNASVEISKIFSELNFESIGVAIPFGSLLLSK